MIAAKTARGKRIALFGLGGSGRVSAHALAAGGAELFCFDDNPESVAKAAAEGLSTADLHTIDFSTIDALLLSPGVPLTHPKPHWSVQLATAAEVPVIGDIELFARERRATAPQAPFIAVTGTNGKSTTAALIAHLFAHAGRDTQLGGNIGTAVLALEPPTPERVYVVECSSYQIDLAPSLDPSVGILLNLSPDHLDRHGSMENYAAVKTRLVAASDTAVIGMDDPHSREIADRLAAAGRNVIRIAGERRLENGVFLDGTLLVDSRAGEPVVLVDLAEAPALRGRHNGQNAAAAWLAGELTGLTAAEMIEGFRTFPGLRHRMEQVGRRGRVLFVNDSKATNQDAAARALASFERIYWIAGGLAKAGGIADLAEHFPRIAKAYLIGEAAPDFAATLGDNVAYQISGTLDAATRAAAADAAADPHHEPVVLLSPAAASFDQYANFEVRGEAFREQVLAIADVVSFKEAC